MKSIQIGDFPNIQFSFETYDINGQFLDDLKTEDVQLQENGVARSLQSLEIQEPGMQTIFAINASPVMANRVEGVPYFEMMKEALLEWGRLQPSSGPDDYSLITNAGLQAIRLEDAQEWVTELEEYEPNLFLEQQSLVALNQALDLAVDPNANRDMKRSILYITPLPLTTSINALPNLTNRAVQQDVQVNVWLVTSEAYESTEGVELLRRMVEETGGNYFRFYGVEELPDIDNYFQPLRYFYLAEYLSGISQSGDQSLSILIDRGDFQAESQPLSFSLEVSPPNPIFLSPPSQVVRSWVEIEELMEEKLDPVTVPIEVMIEFQDGYEREIVRTALYANEELVAENLSAPYDRFEWNLNDITETGLYRLSVEVEDEIGMTQTSIPTPVDVIVEEKPLTWFERLTSQGLLPVVVAVSFAAIIFGGVWLMVRGKPWQWVGRRREKKKFEDPVSQPVPISQDHLQRSAAIQSPTWPLSTALHSAPARLFPVSEEGDPIPGETIPLNRKEITFGSDPKMATHVLASKSVNGLHARLVQEDENEFVLSDADSIAGTWVNYAPVTSGGKHLKHGDLIHFGRVVYRFELRQPPPRAQIIVKSYNK